MKNYNYLYYENCSTHGWGLADEQENYQRAQLYLLDSIARSLSCLADAYEHSHGITEPKEVDYDIGSAEADHANN